MEVRFSGESKRSECAVDANGRTTFTVSLPPSRRVKWGSRATYTGGAIVVAGLVLFAVSQGAGVLALIAGAMVIFAGHKLSAWDESFEPAGLERRVGEPVELDRWFYAALATRAMASTRSVISCASSDASAAIERTSEIPDDAYSGG